MTEKELPKAVVAQPHEAAEQPHNLFTDLKDGAVRLVHEAYEHPRTTAAIAAGAMATGALLIASKGRAAKALFGAEKEVLLVEDTPYMGRAYKAALEEEGHRVTWVTGVSRPAPFTATTPEGKQVVLDLSRYKHAFVDGDLKGSYLQGEHVVDALKKSHVPSVGTSTIPELNARMLANGATLVGEKPTVLTALANHSINWDSALRHPGDGKIAIDLLSRRIVGESGKPIRQKAETLLTRALADGI